MGHAASVIEEFARPSVERVVYFGCERAVREARAGSRTESGEDGAEDAAPGRFLDFRECVSRREGAGTVYVYQPSRHRHDELIAKACKSLFFEAVLDNEARRAPDSALPLAGYIADEFQRFVTADAVHGEQSFLDVCRAFGAFAVLACQSVASLRYALCDLERRPRQAKQRHRHHLQQHRDQAVLPLDRRGDGAPRAHGESPRVGGPLGD